MRSPLDKPHRKTSGYGWRTLDGKPDYHNGIDIVPADNKHPTNLYATVDGTVIECRTTVPDSHTGLGVTTLVTGNFANIRTKDGYTVIYRHMKAGTVKVKNGQAVKAGDAIGVMGTTGQSTGIHLHYEIRDPQNQSFDPEPYIGNNVSLPSQSGVNYNVKLKSNVNVRTGAGTNFAVVKSTTILAIKPPKSSIYHNFWTMVTVD